MRTPDIPFSAYKYSGNFLLGVKYFLVSNEYAQKTILCDMVEQKQAKDTSFSFSVLIT